MPRWLRITLKTVAIVLGLVFVLWIGLAAYVYYNKERILKNITAQLNEGIKGKLTIEQMEPALLKGFPGISVSLKNVLLRDDLWNQHKHDLINAKTLYVSVDVLSALTGQSRIRNLTIADGSIYLYTDTNGVSNMDLFKKPSSKDPDKKKGLQEKINELYLDNVKLTIDNQQKHKLFDFAIDNFQGSIKYAGNVWNGRAKIKMLVNNFVFNAAKGSFMKGKTFETDLNITYSHIKHQLIVPKQRFVIGGDDFDINSRITFRNGFNAFTIDIQAPDILFKNASALLTPAIASKIKDYDLKEPVDVKASLRGGLKAHGDPDVSVVMKVKNNTLVFSGEEVTDCTFTGTFTNQLSKKAVISDENSAIALRQLTGKLFGIEFKADSIQILNLKNPVFTGMFKSDFALNKLNNALGENFTFSAGDASMSLLFKVPFNPGAKGQRYIYGGIQINGAAANYVPRNLKFKNSSLNLTFNGRDLLVENMRVQTGNTSMRMQASLLDFSNLYYTNPGKLVVDCKVQSPVVNLNEFMAFLGKRKELGDTRSKKPFSRRLDQLLDEANMRMRVNVNKVIYKNFVATNVSSDIVLREAGISVRNLTLNQGGGSLHVDGEIDQSGPVNKFNITSDIRNVDVEKFFYAFENFGQSAITDANLRGSFFGKTSISGAIRDDGQIVPRSFDGSVSFDLRNGSLVNFEPMRKIGAFAFPNRDFRNIEFLSLKNTLDIHGSKIFIRPMEIQSSVINIFAEGVYSLTTGTNIAIKIPLRNPKKDEMIADESLKKERALKGIVINLRALDGEDGKVRFKLGKRAPDGYGEEGMVNK